MGIWSVALNRSEKPAFVFDEAMISGRSVITNVLGSRLRVGDHGSLIVDL